MSAALSGTVSVALNSALIYIFVVVAMRVFGKSEVAQLSVIDLVFIMLLGNAVQNAMVGNNTTVIGGVVAAITLFVMDWLMKKFNFKHHHILDSMSGGPLVLIHNGKILENNLKRAMITQAELMEALREHGVSGPSDVDMAVLEEDGNISVLEKKDDSGIPAVEKEERADLPRRDTKKP